MATAGDEGDRSIDPYASGRRDDVLPDGDSSSSSRVALSTEIVSSRTAPVDGARGGPARDADARALSRTRSNPPRASRTRRDPRASTRSRPHAARPRLERRACRTLPRAFPWARPRTTIASAHGRASTGTFGRRTDSFDRRTTPSWNRRSAARVGGARVAKAMHDRSEVPRASRRRAGAIDDERGPRGAGCGARERGDGSVAIVLSFVNFQNISPHVRHCKTMTKTVPDRV